jgi:plastocyanin
MRHLLATLVRMSIGACTLAAVVGCGSDAPTTNDAADGQAAAESAAVVTMTEKVGPPDSYSFAPTSVTVKSGQGVSVVNKTDEEHKLSCTPDPGIKADGMVVQKAGRRVLTFAKTGSYACASTEHPEAKITVTVT